MRCDDEELPFNTLFSPYAASDVCAAGCYYESLDRIGTQEEAVRFVYAAFHYYCYTSQCRSSHLLCNLSCMCPTCMPSLMGGARSMDRLFTRIMDVMVFLKSKKDNEFIAKVTPIKLFALQILNWHGIWQPIPLFKYP